MDSTGEAQPTGQVANLNSYRNFGPPTELRLTTSPDGWAFPVLSMDQKSQN